MKWPENVYFFGNFVTTRGFAGNSEPEKQSALHCKRKYCNIILNFKLSMQGCRGADAVICH